MPMRRRLRGPIAILAAAAALAFGGAPAEAQDYEYALTDPPTAQTPFIVETGFARQGEADIDGDGSVAANRFDSGVVGRVGLLEPLTWTNSIFLRRQPLRFRWRWTSRPGTPVRRSSTSG